MYRLRAVGPPSSSGALCSRLSTASATATVEAKMKHRPPMVGVPCFLLCQVGPISLMVCPKWSLCKKGTITMPDTAERTNPANAARISA